MSKLDVHIGCAGAVHVLIGLASWIGFFSAFKSSHLADTVILGTIALLETILVLGIKFCITQRWVWYFGYFCWTAMLIASLIPWIVMMTSPPSKDAVANGMTLVFLPLLVLITAIPIAGIIHWNAAQLALKQNIESFRHPVVKD